MLLNIVLSWVHLILYIMLIGLMIDDLCENM